MTIAWKQNLNGLRNALENGSLAPYFPHYNQIRCRLGRQEKAKQETSEIGYIIIEAKKTTDRLS